ncbi:MAG: hypothetical protein WC847_00865 [Candidatus Paceibacterota bacterium]|jgi:hypothetical protein
MRIEVTNSRCTKREKVVIEISCLLLKNAFCENLEALNFIVKIEGGNEKDLEKLTKAGFVAKLITE